MEIKTSGGYLSDILWITSVSHGKAELASDFLVGHTTDSNQSRIVFHAICNITPSFVKITFEKTRHTIIRDGVRTRAYPGSRINGKRKM